MKDNDVVLFVPWGVYACEQQLAMALYLTSQSELRPHFLLISEFDHQFIRQLDAAGIPYSTLDPVRENSQVSVGAVSHNNLNRLPPVFRSLVKGFRWCRRLWLRKRMSRRLTRLLAPRCALVCQDRYIEFFPVQSALQQLRVPIVLMLSGDPSPDGSGWTRRGNYQLTAGLKNGSAPPGNSIFSVPTAVANRLIEWWLPTQVYDSPWGKMLFYPTMQIFLLRIMGMLPHNPWYQGENFADYIMISGVDEAAIYAEVQTEPSKLLFYGSQELDVLYESWFRRRDLRQEIIGKYHLRQDKGILIFSVPNLWEQDIVSEQVHWQSINDILEVLSHQDVNVLISLHPHCDRSLYQWIEEKYSMRISIERLKDILVVAEIFVAAYSSTIRWAIAMGIPVVNLDLWGLNMRQYKDLSGYQTATTISEIDEFVSSIPTPSNYDGLDGGQSPSNDRNEFIVDGRAKERLLGFIQSLDGVSARPQVTSKHAELVH